MSADLLEGLEDGDGTSLDLSMNVNGFAQLVLTVERNDVARVDDLSFDLTPTPEGIERAAKIEKALRAWREHVQSSGLMALWSKVNG